MFVSMIKTYISLYNIYPAWPQDLDITGHIECALGFALFTQAVERNICSRTPYTSANRVYRNSIINEYLSDVNVNRFNKI